MATAFQLGIIFYTFSAVEFNVNVISVALWPWTTYFFWQAYKKDKLKNWVLFGVFMALNILNKYVWPNSQEIVDIHTWQGQVEYLRGWLAESLTYMLSVYSIE